MNKGLLTSATPEWATPQEFFDKLNSEFGFNLDPCATKENAKCSKFYTREDDGLSKKWEGSVFMNPPYGKEIARWMKKAYESSLQGSHVVCLVPARTDTKWFHDYAFKGEVRFLKGRLKFGNSKSSAPFPNALVIFKPRTA